MVNNNNNNMVYFLYVKLFF